MVLSVCNDIKVLKINLYDCIVIERAKIKFQNNDCVLCSALIPKDKVETPTIFQK